MNNLISNPLRRKCEYADRCKWYHPDSVTCNQEPGRYCGIFRAFEDNKENKK